MRTATVSLLLALLCIASTHAQSPAPQAATRVGLALIIGNSNYAQAELPSVDVDRKTMATAFRSLGFQVREVENLQRPRDFEEELRTFLKDESAAPEDTLVVYYSGHGLQIEGRAYLLGTGLTGSSDMSTTLRDYSEDVDKIIRIMEEAAPAARVLIVDACRNNAFAAAPRKAGPAFQRGTEDTYLLFADEPGKVVPARSENSVQSPFTAGLIYAFENSDKGLEERFQIARDKTRELNPDQNPQLLKSDSSPDRNRPFLDHGGRSTPLGSAAQMLDEAEPFYQAGSWSAFREKISAARILSAEPELTARLEKELAFCDAVVAAVAAQAHPAGPEWAEAATSWQKAGLLFPSRAWVLERAAIAWLLADQVRDAVALLARLQTYDGNPMAKRAEQMLAKLLPVNPALEAIAKSVATDRSTVTGPEFEKYVRKQ